jgi:hypothetical protein
MSTPSRAVPALARSLRLRALPWWLLAATCSLASPAWAAEPPSNVRYTRPAPKVRPVEDPKAGIEAARKEAAAGRSGPSSAEPWLARMHIAVELAAIDDQLRLLEALLREAGPDDKDYPDYLFRYADLCLDRKAIFENQAGALYEQIHSLEQEGKPEAARRIAAKQRELQKKARAASEMAVKAYAVLVQGRRWQG